MNKYFITIAGNIGVGKSALTQKLADKLGWEPVFEAVAENPFLADFYADMPRWGFHSQVFFLSRRLRQHHEVLNRPNSVIQDRSVYEDANIFARNLHTQGALSDRDWQVYYDLYTTLTDLLPPPHLVIYLKASVATLQRRIQQRGRGYEQSISPNYLAQLNTLYDEWIANFTLSPTLTVETDQLDYMQHDEHLDQIWHKIEQQLRGKTILQLR